MKSTTERLAELERRAANLQPSAAQRSGRLSKAGEHAEAFMEALPARPVYDDASSRDEAMSALAIDSAAGDFDDILDTLASHVDPAGHNLGNSGFMAYIPSGGLFDAAIADFLAAVSNRYAGVSAAAAGATRMEETLIRWLASVFGYPAEAEGDLTSGGSIAAVTAIVAARDAAAVSATRVPQTVVYLTAETHHTFRKALAVAGLRECIVRKIETDSSRRINPQDLRRQINADRTAGLNPWLIGASAGTTDSGAVDPLAEIADIAAASGTWLHVDAAYGGAFMLSEEGRRRLQGIERSDSLIVDPHKGLFLPCGSGAVLVRNGQHLYNTFHARGAYMQDVSDATERSPCDYSIELSRHNRGLRLWLPLKLHGTDAFAAALEEKLLLAEYVHDELQQIPGIVCGPRPDLSVVTFRHHSDTRALYRLICEDKQLLLTTTTIDGRFTIRIAILAYNTHLNDVRRLLQRIETCCEDLETQRG